MDRYEEALERAKAGKPMDEVFPELKESEDERIRKKLVEYISDWKEGQMRWNSDKEFCSRALAYLEKQKEQKPVEKQDYSGLNDLERAIHRGFLAAGVENVPVTIIKETARDCLAQMKPAEWGEEDIDMFGSIRSTLSVYSHNPNTPKEERERCKKDLAWFDELYHKGCPQPHWKPSEEQMASLDYVLKAYESTEIHMYEGAAKQIRSLYEQLKKL